MEQRFDEATNRETGLYHSEFEHDNCGIGAVVNIKGKKSHATVNNALQIVEKLEHRAGKDAEGKTGDGVGILLQISHKFFRKAVASLGVDLGEERDYGIGMLFFPQDELKRNQAKKMFEVIVEGRNGVPLLERGSYKAGDIRKEGSRCDALHYAGICKASGRCREGS